MKYLKMTTKSSANIINMQALISQQWQTTKMYSDKSASEKYFKISPGNQIQISKILKMKGQNIHWSRKFPYLDATTRKTYIIN